MYIDSDEVDFSQEIVSSDDGSFILTSPEGTEEETEEVEEAEEEEVDFLDESEKETETEIEEESEESESEEEISFKPFEAVINGEKISIDNAEEARKIIENLSKPKISQPNVWQQAQKELGVTTKDLALISAIKSGDKDALLFAAKEGGLDISQLIYDEAPTDFNKDFKPTVPTEGERIINEMTSTGELDAFSKIIDGTDENFITHLSDVRNLDAFRRQVSSGKAAELMPLAKKRAAIEGITLFEAYAKVGHEQKQNEMKTETKKVVVDKTSTKKTPPAKKAPRQSTSKKDSDDIWEMSDEDFDKKYGGRKI